MGTDGVTSQTRLRELVEIWKVDLDNSEKADSTRTSYLAAARQLVEALGDLKVSELTPGRCENHLKKIAAVTPTKAKHHRVVLMALMRIPVRHGALLSNPVREVDGMKKPKKKPVFAPNTEEVKAVYRRLCLYFDQDDASGRSGPRRSRAMIDILLVCIATGCRIGEVLALRWEDINFHTNKIAFTGRIIKAGERSDGTVVKAGRRKYTKGNKEGRSVTMPAFLVNALMTRQVLAVPNPYDAVFATKPGNFYTTGQIHRAFKRFREHDGLDDSWTFHSMRKSMATLLAALDSAETAALQLGHNSTHVTKESYIMQPDEAPDSSAIIQAAYGDGLL